MLYSFHRASCCDNILRPIAPSCAQSLALQEIGGPFLCERRRETLELPEATQIDAL
jgi:hypothetical protein